LGQTRVWLEDHRLRVPCRLEKNESALQRQDESALGPSPRKGQEGPHRNGNPITQFTQRILIGLLSGVAVGLFLGESVAPIKLVVDGFIKLLQMTVLPHVTVSIISNLGRLSYSEVKRLGLRAGVILVLLWILALSFTFLFPLVLPKIASAAFFSTTLLEQRPAFNFIGLYIPANPFHSLANNIVPAVVFFSVIVGVGLIGVEGKETLLEVLASAGSAISRVTRFVVGLTPYGIFAITANAAGTLNLEQMERIELYLVTNVVIGCGMGSD
jgi:Na+/H+-dicarboxylate symporter